MRYSKRHLLLLLKVLWVAIKVNLMISRSSSIRNGIGQIWLDAKFQPYLMEGDVLESLRVVKEPLELRPTVSQALFLCNICVVFRLVFAFWDLLFIHALTNATDDHKYSPLPSADFAISRFAFYPRLDKCHRRSQIFPVAFRRFWQFRSFGII